MNRRIAIFAAFFAVACGAVSLGCASLPFGSRAVPPPPEPHPMELDEYVIGPADVLRITVWKNPELSGVMPVRPDGKISIALLDDVQAAGLTPLELKEVITESLREYVADPDVTIVLEQVASPQVFVLGEVARQGPIPLTRNLRVLDALSISGGFSVFADRNDVRVIRRTAEGSVEYHFDYGAYLDGKAHESNLLLRNGDTIVVPD
jgi:polysaccharide export outer membrane protein